MAVTFYVGPAGLEVFEIDVPDPGHGRVAVRRLNHRFDRTAAGAHEAGEYAGAAMADLLDVVAGLATGTVNGDQAVARSSMGRSLVVARDEAPALLRQLQKAVALAMGGEDRYERVWVDDHVGGLETLCVDCRGGALAVGSDAVSAFCDEYGHHPFGVVSDTSWQVARERHVRNALLLRGRDALEPVSPQR